MQRLFTTLSVVSQICSYSCYVQICWYWFIFFQVQHLSHFFKPICCRDLPKTMSIVSALQCILILEDSLEDIRDDHNDDSKSNEQHKQGWNAGLDVLKQKIFNNRYKYCVCPTFQPILPSSFPSISSKSRHSL